MSERPARTSLTVLGIWIGSPAKLPPLRREGIFRFLVNLVQHLAEYDSLRFEIWCHRINLDNVRDLFAPLLNQPGVRQRVIFCTEFDHRDDPQRASPPGPWHGRVAASFSHISRVVAFWLKDLVSRHRRMALAAIAVLIVGLTLFLVQTIPTWPVFTVLIALLLVMAAVFGVPPLRSAAEMLAMRLWEAFKHFGSVLTVAANHRSEADCFLVQNLDIANSVRLDGPKVVCLHDLYTSEFGSLFASSVRNRRLRFHGERAARAAQELARTGTYFVSNSDHIRRTHALGLIKGLQEDHTGVVLLPGPVPQGIKARLPEPAAILTRFGIEPPYLFYATHVRPYKNVLTLLKALAIVRAEGHDLKLVLTGQVHDDPACAAFVAANRMGDCVTSTGELSEPEMFAVYRSATLVAVPTLSEGGFPWQALEAMAMDVPVVVSRIPVVVERLAYHGFSPETCGLRLFEPTDEHALARSIVEVMGRRDEVLREEAPVRQALLAYGWKDVARQYHKILDAAVRRSQHV